METAPETPDEGTAERILRRSPCEEETPAEDAGSEPADTVAAYEQEVFDLVNQIREENGLEPFVYNETLAETARAHSQDMIDRNFFSHTNPDGEDPFDRMRDNGLSFSMAAENIAAGQRTPEEVVNSWMNSEGHRANILGGCEELGVGLALGGSYGYYWTQCFATCAEHKNDTGRPPPGCGRGAAFLGGRTHEIQPYAPGRTAPGGAGPDWTGAAGAAVRPGVRRLLFCILEL